MPVVDAHGELLTISRLEYWVLHVADPGTIWWRWTGGMKPVSVLDRAPIFILVGLWLTASLAMGQRLLAFESSFLIQSRLSHCLAIFLGHSVLGIAALVYSVVIGCGRPEWFLFLCFGVYLISLARKKKEHSAPGGARLSAIDDSFRDTIRRRVVGLLFVGCMWLASIQVYGASIPTADRDIRSTEWRLIKHFVEEERLAIRGNLRFADLPSLSWVPSLYFASWGDYGVENERDNANWRTTRVLQSEWLYKSVVAGKVINAVLCVLAIYMLGVIATQFWGALPGIAASFLVFGSPGISELIRLGRTETMMGVWFVISLTMLNHKVEECSPFRSVSWWIVQVGMFATNFTTWIMVGLPAILFSSYQNRIDIAQAFVRGPWLRTLPIGGLVMIVLLDAWLTGCQTIRRMFWNSDLHGLAMVPMALGGWTLFLIIRNEAAGSRKPIILIVWFKYWLCLLLLMSINRDREWAGILFPMALFGAHCIRFLMRHSHSLWLSGIMIIALAWSVIVIPIWPMSDNRLLVSWQTMRDEGCSPVEYALNSMLEHGLNRGSKILMIGTVDDFGVIAKCESLQATDEIIWLGDLDAAIRHTEMKLKDRGFTHVFVDWKGAKFIDSKPELDLETKVRNVIDELCKSGRLKMSNWVNEFPDGEIFQVLN